MITRYDPHNKQCHFLDSLIGAVGGLLGSGINAASQSATNHANKEIAQMNNEFNERMLQKQMDYNTEMWNKQNAYNSASAQRERLEAAGLNPYMMMSGGSAGTAQSAQGVNPPTATPVTMQAPQIDLSTPSSFLAQAIELDATKSVREGDARLKNAQAEQVGIENQYKAQELIAKIQNMKADTFFKRSAENLNAMNYARLQAMFSSDVMKAERQAQNEYYLGLLTQSQTINQLLQGRLTQKELQYFDQKAIGELSIMAAQQYALVAQGKQSEAQAKQAIANQLEIEARTRGIKIENHVKSALINTTIGTAQQLYKEQYWRARSVMNEAQSNPVYTGSFATGYRKFMNTYIAPLGSAFWGTLGYGAGAASKQMNKPNKVKGFGK